MNAVKEKFLSKSPTQTINFAKKLAKQLKKGDVIAFVGDLGAGKTTFIKGLAVGLGLRSLDEVKSPTFVLMHVYETKIPIYHFDLYRLSGADELDSIDLEDFLFDSNAITCVEWAEKARDRIPDDAYHITFKHVDDKSREIKVLKKK